MIIIPKFDPMIVFDDFDKYESQYYSAMDVWRKLLDKVVNEKIAIKWDQYGYGSFHMITNSIKANNTLQLTYFDSKGLPCSDMQFKVKDIGSGRNGYDILRELPISTDKYQIKIYSSDEIDREHQSIDSLIENTASKTTQENKHNKELVGSCKNSR